jgi:hypothetical protein
MAISELREADLHHLEQFLEGALDDAYRYYRNLTGPGLALAAALVEIGIDLHGLGTHIASPGNLLLGDLCLARASRLLAEGAEISLQVSFARTIERAAARASDEDRTVSASWLRARLTKALKETP